MTAFATAVVTLFLTRLPLGLGKSVTMPLLGSMLPPGGTIVAFGVSAYAIMLIAVALLPETAGMALDTAAPVAPASESDSYGRSWSVDNR